ncbi:hypothetical protein MKW92_027298 [Papaver armeniacum]|nr:hypothetical protein MKW92_027298 [Papaver armeniacum]
MRKVIKYDMEVATSADSVWAVYSSPDIPRLLRDVLLPGVFEKLDVIEGNGGVGTVLDIAFPPGAVPRSYKEKFVNIDREKRLKEVIMIEGGYLDMGCTFYLDRIHVVEKSPSSCYAGAMSKLITTEPLKSMAEVISNYVIQNESFSARIILNKQSVVKKEIRYDLEVPTSADSIWSVYSCPDIPRLLRDVLLPGVFEKLDVIKGNGGVGTVLDIVFPPGAVPRSYKEKFVTIDREKRLKEVIMIEGGYLDMGCTFYLDRIHVVEKTPSSCVIESSIVYEVKEEYADAMSKLITTEPLKSMAEVISNYVIQKESFSAGNIFNKNSLVKKEIRYDLEVPTSADSIWSVYSCPDIPRLLRDVLLPGVFEKLDVIKGNGGVGTVLDIVFPPGAVPRRYKEKFVNINHEKRLKEVIMIEGGYLDMGCTSYLDRIHVVEKTSKSCIIKSSIVYEVKQECAAAMSKLITTEPLKSMAEVISNYAIKQQSASERNISKKQSLLRKEITYETEVQTSADSIWNVYSSPDIPRLLRDVLLPGVFEKLDVIAGNGGVGTVLDIAFPLGAVPRRYKEKFVKINHEKRLKEVVMIEGGYLDMGCTFYMDRIHVIEKTPNSCVIESSIIYEVKEEYAAKMAKLITTEPLESMAEVISGYVLKKRLQVFGFEIKPKLRFNLLLCLIICLVIAGGMFVARVPL